MARRNSPGISARRVFIVVALLVAAVAGALLRTFSDPQSTAYDVGTLLMVMWVPAVGNVISFLMKKLKTARPAPPAFSPSLPFVPDVAIQIRWHAAQGLAQPTRERDGTLHCLFVIEAEGFSARVSLPESHVPGEPLDTQAQFLFPTAALPKFSVGSTFQLIQERSSIGAGQVLSWPINA